MTTGAILIRSKGDILLLIVWMKFNNEKPSLNKDSAQTQQLGVHMAGLIVLILITDIFKTSYEMVTRHSKHAKFS